MTRLTPGTRLWIRSRHERASTPPRAYVVKSVGRKWAELVAHGFSRERRVTADMDDRGHYLLDLGGYGTVPALTDAQLVAEEQQAALREHRRQAAAALDSASPDTILTICRLLGVPAPDALPTEAEVLAKYGVVPA